MVFLRHCFGYLVWTVVRHNFVDVTLFSRRSLVDLLSPFDSGRILGFGLSGIGPSSFSATTIDHPRRFSPALFPVSCPHFRLTQLYRRDLLFKTLACHLVAFFRQRRDSWVRAVLASVPCVSVHNFRSTAAIFSSIVSSFPSGPSLASIFLR